MSRPPGPARSESRLFLAGALDRLAGEYATIAAGRPVLRQNLAISPTIDANLLRQAIADDSYLVKALVQVLDETKLYMQSLSRRRGGRGRVLRIKAHRIARDLDSIARTLREDCTATKSRASWGKEARMLGWLARLLPTHERSRFVSEALGNIGDCEHWYQRVDHLVCLALGTPRLAWMMRREGRRGRAE